ncbi:MAG TPA: hypothetical protein VM531_11040 [Sphingomicrobium sp.]|jgi:lysozyme|nr:hypothetical protein [Sphingomicrobium sp.]
MSEPNPVRLRSQLILHEGRKLKPYVDTRGNVTIGIGRNLTGRGLSSEEVEFLYQNDVRIAWTELVKAKPFVKKIDEVRQRVFLDLSFNMGMPVLLTFKQTLAAAERGDWWLVGQGLRQSAWQGQVGDGAGGRRDRADRLIEMVTTGVDAPDIP